MLSRSDEFLQKYRAVLRHLESRGLEAAVITRRNNFAWFTGGGRNHVGLMSEVGAAALLITPEKVLCITNNIEAGRIIAEEMDGLNIEVRASDWWDAAGAARLWATELGNRPAAADEPVAAIGRALPALGPEFEALRLELNEAEMARFRGAAKDAGLATEAACRQVRPGMTEHELAALMAVELVKRDLRVSVALVANEERIRKFRHPIPTNARFTKYGMAVTGAERDGMFVSLTRLFTFGPIDDDLRRRHEAVCAVDATMIAATRPGATLGEILAICQQTYATHGYAEEWKLHHQGGLTGYRPRENYATPGCATRVLVNQAYAWNPSITGTKSEDTILVLPAGNEMISVTGEWPTTAYAAGGKSWLRNDILKI